MYRKCGRGANALPECQLIHHIAYLLAYTRTDPLKKRGCPVERISDESEYCEGLQPNRFN